MKSKIWLSLKRNKDQWCYALARYEDGTIRVVENLSLGFCNVGGSDEGKPYRLDKKERLRIIQDLYIACCHELKIDSVLSCDPQNGGNNAKPN